MKATTVLGLIGVAIIVWLALAIQNAVVVRPLAVQLERATLENRVVALETEVTQLKTLAQDAKLTELPKHLAAQFQVLQGMNAKLQELDQRAPKLPEDDKKKK